MKPSLKILILEDSPDDAQLIERELTKAAMNFTSLVVESQPGFEQGLVSLQPDVILADHYLPQFNSIEALKIVMEYNRQNKLSVPFILVTGTIVEEFAVQSIKAGAADFILKDRLKRLPSAIINALEKSASEMEKAKYLDEIIARERLMGQAEKLAHFGSWYYDIPTDTYRWSDETFRIFGYEPGEIMPTYALLLQHIHPDDRPEFKSNRSRLISTFDSFENDFRIIDRHGRLKHLALKVEVNRDETRKPVALVGVNLDITRQKEADQLLRRSREEYKSLFDQNPDMVYSLDLEGNFTKANAAMIASSKLTSKELLSLNFRPFITPADGERVEHYFQLAAQGKPQRYLAKTANHNGEEFFLDITNMPIIVDGEVMGVHGVAKDITEKIRLERLLDKAYELARIGGWEADLVTRKIKWSPITRELLEVGPDFCPDIETGLGFYREGESRDTATKAFLDAVEHGKPFDLELQAVTAKGNYRWVRSIAEVEIQHGKVVKVYGSFQDIHERKSAEEKLRESHRENDTILESISDAFFTIDKNWIVTYWNREAEKVLQASRDFIIGKNLWDVFPLATSMASYTQLHKAMDQRVPVVYEEYYSPFKLSAEIKAYPSATGLSVYCRDVTALKNHVLEIEQQNKRLTEIAWTLSHELRAPLARLMGLVQIVKDYPEQETYRPETLQMILGSADELDDVIRKIVRKAEELGL